MIKLFSSSLVATVLLIPMAQAAEIEADSIINSVTVYPNSAKVTRISELMLTAGSNDIIIHNLPINLNVNSLRVSGDATGEVSLGNVELIRQIKRELVQKQERSIRQQIEALQEDRQSIKDALSRNQSQLQYIHKMVLGNDAALPLDKKQQQVGTYTHLPLEQWTQAWQTLESATATAQEKIRASQKSLKENDIALSKLDRELNLVAVNQRETRSAKLHIESQEATKLNLSLTYQINGANWAPVYDADLKTQNANIELKTLAQISQRTGEDWNNTNITLSTLRPSAGTQLPVLNTWVIDYMPEFLANSADSAFMEADEQTPMIQQEIRIEKKRMMASKPAPSRKIKITQAQSQIISTNFSAEYKVPGKISLKSGSNKQRFALTSQSYNATIHLASAPRFDPRAMILATTQYQGETPLLPGNLSLYRDGSFVGSTHLAQKQSGEELKLAFGEDDKVKVNFLPDPDKKRKNGILFNKKKVVERNYKVSITNNHDKPFKISLYDTIPVAANEEIKVGITGDVPSKNKVDDKQGVLSWERELMPNKKSIIKYGYTVSYPEDKNLPGL